jgi:hypothetical protein
MKRLLTTATVCFLSASTVHGATNYLPTIPVGTTEVKLDLFASGFNNNVLGVDQNFPAKITPVPDGSGRMVVSTFGGLLRMLDSDGNISGVNSGVYLNTNTAETSIAPWAYGLTSMAFHPDFANNAAPGYGKLYALVTEGTKASPGGYDFIPVVGTVNQHAAVLVEYTVDPGSIGSDALFTSGGSQNVTRRELFVAQEPDNEHNFGDLAFDANGLLHISVGDGLFNYNGGVNPEAQNAQELGTVLGKVLRIDPLGNNSANGNYGIVASNVFAADGDPNTLGEIYSYGHRNPWRISVDQPTGTVIVGEVGHFNIEEVNVSTNGGNFGWNDMEGSFLIDQGNGSLTPDAGDVYATANGMTPPTFEYDHNDGKSVTGGFVYRGSAIPALYGKYIFADFQGGDVATSQRLFAGDLGTGNFEQLLIAPGSAGLNSPVSFGEDENGELYVVSIGGNILTINPVTPTVDLSGDIDNDGFVGIADLNIVLGNWNAGTPPVAPGPDLLSDFSSVNLTGTYAQWGGGTFTSNANDFRVEANDFGGGWFVLPSTVDATGEISLEVQLDVNAANVADAFNVVLIDADGTERVYRFSGLTVGNNQTLSIDLSNFLQDNQTGSTPGLDIANLVTFHLQGTFGNGDPGDFMDLTFDNLALTGGVIALDGDVNGDGFVGIADLNIVLGTWNNGTPPAGNSSIPEPASLALLGLGGLAMLRRRR